MSETFQLKHFASNVLARRLVVTENGAHSEHTIIALKDFSREPNSRPMVANVFDKVSKQVELHFSDDSARVHLSKCVENVVDKH